LFIFVGKFDEGPQAKKPRLGGGASLMPYPVMAGMPPPMMMPGAPPPMMMPPPGLVIHSVHDTCIRLNKI